MSTETLNLTKGERVDLTKSNPGLSKVRIGLGWDVNAGNGAAFDLDAFLFANKGGKLQAGNNSVIFFGNKKNAAVPGVEHHGDNLTGVGDGDDEIISVDLSAVNAETDELIVGVNIYQAGERRQNFGQVNNAFIRIVDAGTDQEILKYDLSEDVSTGTGMLLGRLYRNNGEWKFQALGTPVSGDINEIAQPYRA